VPGFTLADQYEREMRERCEVAACANRTARRYDRMYGAVDQRQQQLQCFDANSGKSFGEHIRAQRHRRADHGDRQGIADTGRVTAQQIHLQFGERFVRDPHVGEVAEAGVDAVGRRIVVGSLVNDDACRAHALARHVAEREWLVAVRDGDQIIERERFAVEEDHDMSIPLLATGRT
jgi:hypothetical protein